MKKYLVLLLFILFVTSIKAQRKPEKKVEIIPLVQASKNSSTVQGSRRLVCSVQGVPIKMSASYELLTMQTNILPYLSEFAVIQVNKGSYNLPRKIKIRGNSELILIVDGVRRDSSLLSEISPSTIDSIRVIKNAGGQFARQGD